MNDKEQAAQKRVKHYMWWSMGAGLIPIPVVDLVAVSGVQLKMLREIADIYGVEYPKERVKMVVTALIGYIVPETLSAGLACSLLKAVPVVGEFLGAPSMAAFCAASSYAIGKVFIQHFESGGTFLTFDPAKVRDHFQQVFRESGQTAANAGPEGGAEAPA